MKFELILLNDFGPSPFYHFLEDTNFNTATSIPLIFDHISTNAQTATILPNILEKPLQLSNRNICSIPLVDCETTMNYFLIYKSALETKKDALDFIDFILNYPFCV